MALEDLPLANVGTKTSENTSDSNIGTLFEIFNQTPKDNMIVGGLAQYNTGKKYSEK
jgi:hypothetical protein